MKTMTHRKAACSALLLASTAAAATPAFDSLRAAPAGTSAKAFRDCRGADQCPEMIPLPAGTFVMGSPKSEQGRFDDEDQKTVAVASFAIGKYPVTRGQWAAFVKATGRRTPQAPCAYAPAPHPSWRDPGYPQGDDHPVVCVTWKDASDYVGCLSRTTGKTYRLPTNAQWEYAARAGTTTPFPWGATASHAFANYGLDECCGPKAEGRDRWETTSPVGAFPPNAFGLYDMHGNVFEWIETCADATENPKDFPRPKAAKGCVYRYARGGVYGDRPAVMRSAAKNVAPPPGDTMTIETYRSAGFGFRVVRSER